jgi:hypothetical protein
MVSSSSQIIFRAQHRIKPNQIVLIMMRLALSVFNRQMLSRQEVCLIRKRESVYRRSDGPRSPPVRAGSASVNERH